MAPKKCPDGWDSDEYGNCWRLDIKATLSRGVPCEEGWKKKTIRIFRPADAKSLIRTLAKDPKIRAAMKANDARVARLRSTARHR